MVVIKQKLPLILKCVWLWFLIQTAYLSYWPYNMFMFAPTISNVLAWSATQSLLQLLIFPMVILNLSEHGKNRLVLFLKWFMAIDAALLICDLQSMFTAMTIDALLIACFFLAWRPFKNKLDWIGIVLSLWAIWHTHARTAAMAIAIMILVRVLQIVYERFNIKIFWFSIVLVANSFAGFLYYYWPRILNDPRIGTWQSFYQWWYDHANGWLGTGLGSVMWYGLYLDPGEQYRGQGIGFYMAHSDPIQLLMESGWIGLFLSTIAVIYIGLKLKEKAFATWVSVILSSFFYYPLHCFPTQFLMLILISRIKYD